MTKNCHDSKPSHSTEFWAQLIQSGGEGMVFRVGQTAVKLYHQAKPQANNKNSTTFFNRTHTSAIPIASTTAASDGSARQFHRLPDATACQRKLFPIKFLSKAAFWRKHGLTTTAVLTLFQQLHTTISTLHNQGIIIGDLNDQNIFITPTPCDSATLQLCYFLIDVDSYQIGRFPCPVAMDLFVDPNLYGIPDLSKRPFFSPATDWYAYFVLLVRSLLHIHPYGGVHKQHKSLAARATAGLSILNADITYPSSARPRESLPDDMLQHLHRIFDLGERPPFPSLHS